MQELVLLGNIIMKFKTVNWITNKKSSSYKPQAPKAASSGGVGPPIKNKAASRLTVHKL
jgi:hypothetical protein